MNAQQVFDSYVKSLSTIYEKREAENISHWVLEEKSGLTKAGLLIHGHETISEVKANEFTYILLRLMKGEPVQYVLGVSEFYGLKLKVDKSVLIPRPETEELVDWIIKEYRKESELRILDIGTGSGCIAIALKKNLPQAEVFATDISDEALKVAEENAATNHIQVNFIKHNIFSTELTTHHSPFTIHHSFIQRSFSVVGPFIPKSKNQNSQFNIIVSNPPYILQSEMQSMHKNVVQFEPHEALFVSDEDPLKFYKAILLFAESSLSEHGTLFFEVNEQLAITVESLLKEHGYQHTIIRSDMNGKKRMIMAAR